MLFGVNTLGGPWNIVLYGGPDSPEKGGRGVGGILPIMDPLQAWLKLNLKFCVHIDGWGAQRKKGKSRL